MRKLKLIVFVISTLILGLSCKQVTDALDEANKDPNRIAGDANVPIGSVGNTFTTIGVNIGGQSVSIPHTIKIVKNENGVATINIQTNISTIKNNALYKQYNTKYNLDDLINRIPSAYKDANGNIDANVQMKITSEGIQDYINKDGKPHTIVKFDGAVGDQYNLTKSSGKTLSRTVTQKSTTDDFSYGFMNIKTMTTEQTSSYPGVKKIVYKTNHKYGLVYAEIQFEDGSKVSSFLSSSITN
jgi:hypothetical protein